MEEEQEMVVKWFFQISDHNQIVHAFTSAYIKDFSMCGKYNMMNTGSWAISKGDTEHCKGCLKALGAL